jgi:hypothetical protein
MDSFYRCIPLNINRLNGKEIEHGKSKRKRGRGEEYSIE